MYVTVDFICIGWFKLWATQSQLECQSSKREIVGSSPALGKNFSLSILAFFEWPTARISQYKWNQPWHTPSLNPVLARELISSMFLLVQFSFNETFSISNEMFALCQVMLIIDFTNVYSKLVLHVGHSCSMVIMIYQEEKDHAVRLNWVQSFILKTKIATFDRFGLLSYHWCHVTYTCIDVKV